MGIDRLSGGGDGCCDSGGSGGMMGRCSDALWGRVGRVVVLAVTDTALPHPPTVHPSCLRHVIRQYRSVPSPYTHVVSTVYCGYKGHLRPAGNKCPLYIYNQLSCISVALNGW